jgi:hypothetical protein
LGLWDLDYPFIVYHKVFSSPGTFVSGASVTELARNGLTRDMCNKRLYLLVHKYIDKWWVKNRPCLRGGDTWAACR